MINLLCGGLFFAGMGILYRKHKKQSDVNRTLHQELKRVMLAASRDTSLKGTKEGTYASYYPYRIGNRVGVETFVDDYRLTIVPRKSKGVTVRVDCLNERLFEVSIHPLMKGVQWKATDIRYLDFLTYINENDVNGHPSLLYLEQWMQKMERVLYRHIANTSPQQKQPYLQGEKPKVKRFSEKSAMLLPVPSTKSQLGNIDALLVRMRQLESEGDYLNEEELHLIGHTYLSDLADCLALYEQLTEQNQEQVNERIHQVVQRMETRIDALEVKINQQKMKQLQLTLTIIDSR